MKNIISFVFVAALAVTAVAQEVNGPNANLMLNGQVPSVADPVGHRVAIVVPEIFTLDLNSGANALQPFILLAQIGLGATNPFNPGNIPVPWAGSIDLGGAGGSTTGILVVADGLTQSVNPVTDAFALTDLNGNYSQTNFAQGALVNIDIGIQAIMSDPGNPPFNFDNTEEGTIGFDPVPPITCTSLTLTDDDSQVVPLVVPVTFYGTVYTQLFVCSNGFVTFNAGSADFTETEAEFFDGWLSPPNPGAAVFYSDLNRGNTGIYKVTEDNINNSVQVDFMNQNHWSSQEPAGDFSVRFDNATLQVVFDHSLFIPATINTDDGIIGITDGDASVGIDTSLSNGLGTGLAMAQGTYVSTGMPDSIGETIPANTALTHTSPLTFQELGGGTFTIF